MQDCDSGISCHYHSQFLYIVMCCLYVANLLCFSTECNKQHIYREHVWWSWQHGHLFTINKKWGLYSIPFVSLDSSVIPLPPFLPCAIWDKDSYTGHWLTLISCAWVLPFRLILFDLTFSLVPVPLFLLASVALKYLLYFLCVKGNKC
jgi:hypothetical protein